jgi:hypoxanthine phosphoribosyltransferase
MPTIEPMITADEIGARIQSLAAEIRAAYGDENITCIGVLKGSILFLSDLVRAIPGDVELEFLGVSSYHGTHSSGEVRITHDLHAAIDGKHVLVVEDILDTGLTLSYLKRALEVRNPASLRIVTLLDKPSRRTTPVEVDFVGFTIPDRFVVGYGLDLDQKYRNLPFIGVYHP